MVNIYVQLDGMVYQQIVGTSVFDFHSKNIQITLKLLTQGYR